ncbi:FtsK/SpoIIIE domain-containing protein [Embleya sp. NPDC050154]|uniref:FtsK/SpoIIIE domain-containing protein n=1 Tax=Embleya sp. NPDC050154 TaxID=3363988 RepID=UPI0037B01D76
MRLTVTTVDAEDGLRRDHLVDLPPGSIVADLAIAVRRQAAPSATPTTDRAAPAADLGAFLDGAAPTAGQTLYLGTDPIDPQAPLTVSGIREATVLGLGAPAAEPDLVHAPRHPRDPQTLVEVHAVSGPFTGRVWPLGPGSHEIGADEGCAIRLPVAGVPPRGLWVTVCPDGSAYWHRTVPDDGTVHGREVAPPPTDAITAAAALPRKHEERILEDEREADLKVERESARIAPPEGPVLRAPAPPGTDWTPNADLVVGPSLLRLSRPVEPDADVTPSEDGIGLDYNRPPRIAPHLDAEKMRLPTPPVEPNRLPFPLLVMIAPLVMGLAMVWFFHSYFYLIFCIMSPFMAIANWISGRRGNRVKHQLDGVHYRRRLRVLHDDIRTAVRRERIVRGEVGPDPAAVALIATGPGARLWERRRRDPDHLVLRIGTVDQPSVKEVEDPARDEHHRVARWTLPDTPIGIEIADHGVLGVAGPTEPVQALARWLVVQAAVLHSPRDLRVVVLTAPDRIADWAWVRWLPHLRPQSRSAAPVVLLGTDPESTANRISELVAQIQSRRRSLGSSMGQAMFSGPDILVIADGARQLREVPGMVQVLTEGPAARVFSVCLDERERLLPEECTAVVLAAGRHLTVRQTGLPDVADVRADHVDAPWCEQVARSLAPLRDVSPEHDSGLPQTVKLLDLLDVEPPKAEQFLARWAHRPASTTFVLGAGYDGPLRIDLVRDGPHGLIAGTTGSGKSELLQSFVAALAVANRPDELTFVLVDYKGGSAFSECAELPHTLGMVTDLDEHLAARALDSLGAELRRREHLLANVGAKDHPEYRGKRAADPGLAPLPRLILVIDEFATLVREVPDFVAGLINIAQRGRSLGIHLVLATQRPAGVVTGDIRANTNLRIALRVTDGGESQDIIDTAEAVHISASTPGRALIRTGPNAAVPFQAAWVGAERPVPGVARKEGATRSVRATELTLTGLGRPASLPTPDEGPDTVDAPNPTDLNALVLALREAAEALPDYTRQPSPWLPALAERVLLGDLPDVERADADAHASSPPPIPYALEDVPQLQEQRVTTVDLSTFGHLYVIGSPRSGRTQVLRTIAGAAAAGTSCADVHLYGIDAGGGGLAALEALPHCGAVVSRHDMERLGRLLNRLVRDLTERQELCSSHNAAGLVELRRLLPAAERPAHILVLLDGWDALVGLLDDHDGGRLVDDVMRLLREGAAAGIHIVATSERGLLSGRLAAHNDHKLLLRQVDRTDYQMVGMPVRKVPAVIPPGRGWHALSQTESQIALLAADPSGQEQAEALRRIGAEATARDAGVPRVRMPVRIPTLPRVVEFATAYEQVPAECRRPMWGLLGIGGDSAEPIGVDFTTKSVFCVIGPSGTGRSTALASLAVSLLAGGTSLVVLTPRESPLRALGQHPQVRLLTDEDPPAEDVERALAELSGPRVVVVDDADLLGMPAADRVLRDLAIAGRDRGQGLLYAGSYDALQVAMGSWLSAARRGSRNGVLLAPKNLQEGDMVGIRLPTNVVRAAPSGPGRAWTAGPGNAPMAVQVPLTVLRPAAG